MAIQDDINVYGKRRVLYGVIAFMVLLYFGRLYQLQMIYADEYGKKSEENSIRTIPKEPIRGYVYDRWGRLVVDNRPAFTVTVMPFEFDKRNIDLLASILEVEPAYVQEQVKKGEQYNRFVPVKVKRDINFKVLSALEEYRDQLPGVDYQNESKRYYTTPARASHILGYTKEISETQLKSFGEGYTQGDVAGATGLEAQYERALRGQKGAEFSTVNVRGQVVGRFDNGVHDIPSLEGDDLLLTMDFSLQSLAESLFADKRGAIVAINPQDGGILAMVSKPDYDLSLFSGVTPAETWRSLNTDESRPLYNRATLTRYPPGSTFKMILAAAALENKIVSPSWRITCGGSFRMGNKVFKDEHIHGTVDMLDAIKRSCNVYFYQLMLKVGLDTWSRYGSEFGFGKSTHLDINEENQGLLPTTDWMNKRYGENGWTRGFLPSLGIGQGELGVTPLQMAIYAMTLGNKGHYYQPHAVRGIIRKATRDTVAIGYDNRMIQLKEDTWRVIREGMRGVVQEPGGTGSLARVKGIESAGKTGTAQNPHGKSHAWYIGFAPFENPQIAIVVMIENVGYGGSFSAPIAGMCIEHYLYRRLIRFDKDLPAKAPIANDNSVKKKDVSSSSIRGTDKLSSTH
jgi:penicillin-binding protein 2